MRFHDLCNPQTFPAEKLFDFFVCATSFSGEKKRKKILVFSLLQYEHSETLRTKCFISLWAVYEGEIFAIIVVRILLLLLARAMNSRSIPL